MIKRVVLMVVVTLMMSVYVNATPFIDIVTFTASGCGMEKDYISHGEGDVNVLNNPLDFVHWIHIFDTTDIGVMNSASLSLGLTDDEVDNKCAFTWEIGLIYMEDRTIDIIEVDIGNYNYDINCSYLENGRFEVLLWSVWGDFTINSSILTINHDGNSTAAPVPEPATCLLMGVGIIGLVAGKKKLIKK